LKIWAKVHIIQFTEKSEKNDKSEIGCVSKECSDIASLFPSSENVYGEAEPRFSIFLISAIGHYEGTYNRMSSM
jgi:hypothetical protein